MDSDETEAKNSTPAPDSTADALEASWQAVLRDWDNDAAHDAYLQLAFERSELGRAAGK